MKYFTQYLALTVMHITSPVKSFEANFTHHAGLLRHKPPGSPAPPILAPPPTRQQAVPKFLHAGCWTRSRDPAVMTGTIPALVGLTGWETGIDQTRTTT